MRGNNPIKLYDTGKDFLIGKNVIILLFNMLMCELPYLQPELNIAREGSPYGHSNKIYSDMIF